MKLSHSTLVGIGLAAVIAAQSASAAIVISEVDAAGSSASYAADWFELTNTGSAAVSLTGWKMDDSSNLFGSAVALRNVSSIAAGQSIVFLEGTASGTTDTAIDAAFKSAWFSTVPTTLTLAGYGGSGVGLSTSGDSVNIFDASGNVITRVDFGNAPSNGATFDNTKGQNNVTLTAASVAGVNGAFISKSGGEIGSPGVDMTPVPLPATAFLLLGGLGGMGFFKRRRAV
jgi:Lamin Tail Domain